MWKEILVEEGNEIVLGGMVREVRVTYEGQHIITLIKKYKTNIYTDK